MGFWRRLFWFLSTEEKPVQKSTAGCIQCRHWVAPNAITQKIVPSTRAIDWAVANGFGRCTSPSGPGADKKRFTKPSERCDQHQMRAAAPPQGRR